MLSCGYLTSLVDSCSRAHSLKKSSSGRPVPVQNTCKDKCSVLLNWNINDTRHFQSFRLQLGKNQRCIWIVHSILNQRKLFSRFQYWFRSFAKQCACICHVFRHSPPVHSKNGKNIDFSLFILISLGCLPLMLSTEHHFGTVSLFKGPELLQTRWDKAEQEHCSV